MKKLFLVLALALLSAAVSAKVELPNFIGDNMVLQQQTQAAIWGTAAPGKNVTIRPGWTKDKTVVKADPETGKWMARIATPAAGGPYDIVISDGEKLTVRNVLIGEVWFCSGQSNMEMPVEGYGSQPAKGSEDLIVHAKPSTPIRMIKIARKSMTTPQDTVTTEGWKVHEPEAVANTSATAYFFAQYLQSVIDIPVGIIESDWGGSSIETWMDEKTIREQFAGEFNLSYLESGKINPKRVHQEPCLLYNGQVHALVPYTIKGMLWYQGETNRGRPEQYVRLQTAYVQMMRDLFQVPDAPFYFVQIAPYKYGQPDGWTSGYFYEAQQKTLQTIPHSGMAATVDIGEFGTIHPCQKQAVGKRLALLALQNDYGVKGIEADAPTYKSFTVQDGKAVVSFNVGPRGLNPMGQDLDGFEVAGADKVFHPAKARQKDGHSFILTCEAVPEPVAVRYCFRNWGVGTVFNKSGIPLVPFRTDDWQL